MKIKAMILLTFFMAGVTQANAQACPCKPEWGCKKITITNNSGKKLSLRYHLCCNQNPEDWNKVQLQTIKENSSFTECFHIEAVGFSVSFANRTLISKSFSKAQDVVCSNSDQGDGVSCR